MPCSLRLRQAMFASWQVAVMEGPEEADFWLQVDKAQKERQEATRLHRRQKGQEHMNKRKQRHQPQPHHPDTSRAPPQPSFAHSIPLRTSIPPSAKSI